MNGRFRSISKCLPIVLAIATSTAPNRLVAQAVAAGGARLSMAMAVRQELLPARDAIWRAWFANDTASLAQLLPAAAAAADGHAWQDRAAILADARRFADGGGKLVRLTFANTRITVHGIVAVIQSDYEFVLENAGRATTSRGRATEVFVREGGRWVNPFWHLQAQEKKTPKVSVR